MQGRARKTASERKTSRVGLTYYRSAGRTSESPFEKKPTRVSSRSRKALVGAVDLLLLVLIAIGFGYSMLVKPAPKLSLTTQAYRPAVVYQLSLTQLFNHFKNRNKLTLDTSTIIQTIQKQFPEVAGGSVELPLFSETPKVNLNISPPAFILRSHNTNYLVDSNGVAVGRKSDFRSMSNLPIINDQSGFVLAPGKQVLGADAVIFINSLLAQTHRAGVQIATLSLPPKAQELDLAAKDHAYYVKFYLGGDPLLQSGQFLAARHQFSESGTQPSEYLDVRVPGKIFYK